MERVMQSWVLLVFTVQLSSAATHSLQYFYTAVTSGINFPEFTVVGLVDGGQFMYYDSKTRDAVPKTEWIKKVDADDSGYWDSQTQGLQGQQEIFKVNVFTLMARFNQTKGVHTVQWMYGCELNDDGTKSGYMQYGYDGEDFIILDLKTLTWTAANAKAFITKLKWDPDVGFNMGRKNYLENTCIEWLKKYVEYGRSTLERKVRPEVSLFQNDSFSPVVCHATGFFPKAVTISWKKNGEDVHEDVELGETLPNQDRTFQKRSILIVSPEELKNNEYTCVIQHSTLEKELKLSEPRVLSVSGGGLTRVLIISVVVLALAGTIWYCRPHLYYIFVWKKRDNVPPEEAPLQSTGSSSTAGSLYYIQKMRGCFKRMSWRKK